jgi:hypothetical protein
MALKIVTKKQTLKAPPERMPEGADRFGWSELPKPPEAPTPPISYSHILKQKTTT